MENGTAHVNGHGATNGAADLCMDYSTDFPELPISAANGATSSKDSIWNRPRPVISKNSSLNFIVNTSERSNKAKAFGNTQSEETKRCQAIGQETGCRIELSESKDGSLSVTIQGPKDKIGEAKDKVIRSLKMKAEEKISIPKDHHRKIIGKEGEALKKLEQETNCSIMIPKRDNTSDVITITGPTEGIRKAVARIKEISQKEASQAVEHIICPRNLYPFVRGPYDEIFDRLTNTGVKINIPPSHANNEVINITGPKEPVIAAAAEIRKIVSQKEKNAKALTVQVPKAQHRYIIGSQRKGLHEILKTTGVSVEVPNVEDNTDNITLRGEQEKLGEALTLVYQRASSVITQTIECPVWLHKYLIGQGGSKLNELVPNRDKVQIDFDKGGHIFLEGSPDEVKVAMAILEKEVNQLKRDKALETLKVDPSLHRHVIGKGGETVKKIRGETDLQISFPEAKTNSDEITIEGNKELVQKAVKEIKDIVAKHENEKSKDIVIENRLHKLIIGKEGGEIKKIREQYPLVVISFPDQKNNSDLVSIRGDKNEVEAVYKILKDKVKHLQESQYQQKVQIFKQFHKNVIGKGGENLRTLMKDTSTVIEIPKEGSDDDKITVTGKKADVEKAIKTLNNIQDKLENMASEDMDIPVKIQGRLLGNGRLLIQHIEDECGGVHIKFPAEKSNSTKVTIRGPKENVAKAVKLLSALAKDKEMSFAEDTVVAKSEFHKFLIGKGGSKINDIKKGLDVRIIFPRDTDTDKETIHLLGKKEDVAQVKEALEKLIQPLNESVEVQIEVDTQHHKHFKRNADLLRSIQKDNGGVNISFPRNGDSSTTVTIKGSRQCVESAKNRIEEIVDDLAHATTIDVEIPSKLHRQCLSKGGAKIHDIESKHNVKIRFPNRNSKDVKSPVEDEAPHDNADLVKITGRDSKCEAAKEELFALVSEKIISIPSNLHRHLIGKEGGIRRDIQQNYDVSLIIPDRGESDEITVVGQADSIEEALKEIREKIDQAFEISLDLSPDDRKYVGSKLNTLKERSSQLKLQVKLPGNDVRLVIIGPEEKAKAFAEEIQGMLEERRNLYTQEIDLASGYHPKLIGPKAKTLKDTEKKFNVEILVPKRESNSTLVIITGKNEDDVFDCIDYLKDEEERWLEYNHEKTKYNAPRAQQQTTSRGPAQNVVIQNAPWQMNVADFPEMGANAGPAQAVGGAWGAARRW